MKFCSVDKLEALVVFGLPICPKLIWIYSAEQTAVFQEIDVEPLVRFL